MLVSLSSRKTRTQLIADFRRLLPRLEAVTARQAAFAFGLPAIDAHLPDSGLAANALHEIAPCTDDDAPSAFGFAAALTCRLPPGPIVFTASRRVIAGYGFPHGHGLRMFGVDPARIMFVETPAEQETLWAIEESLRSRAPIAVIGASARELTLKMSRRLQVAAGKSAAPLFLLLPPKTLGSSAASTRWRIGGAEADRDRFGLIIRWRWRTTLERCRNGRTGEWLVEYDHAAHCFSLAASLADSAFSRERGEKQFSRAG